MADTDENTPTVNREQSFDVSLLNAYQPQLVIQQVNRNSSDAEIIDADVNIANYTLIGLCLGWKAPRLTIDSACKLANTTMKALEIRRKLLNRQYGHKDDANLGASLSPID